MYYNFLQLYFYCIGTDSLDYIVGGGGGGLSGVFIYDSTTQTQSPLVIAGGGGGTYASYEVQDDVISDVQTPPAPGSNGATLCSGGMIFPLLLWLL